MFFSFSLLVTKGLRRRKRGNRRGANPGEKDKGGLTAYYIRFRPAQKAKAGNMPKVCDPGTKRKEKPVEIPLKKTISGGAT
jgi:hypothetical protein